MEYEDLARTLFAEADKSNMKAFERDATAIGHVINTRMNNPGRFGEDPIHAPDQFTGVGGDEWNKALEGKLTADEERYYKKAMQIVKGISAGKIADPTGGADHYYNPKLASPAWGKLTTPDSVEKDNFYYEPGYKTKSHQYFKETLSKTGGKSKAPSKNKKIQEALNARGYSLEVDGKMGKMTKSAIKEFQRDNDLKPDGIVGKNTRKVLYKKSQ